MHLWVLCEFELAQRNQKQELLTRHSVCVRIVLSRLWLKAKKDLHLKHLRNEYKRIIVMAPTVYMQLSDCKQIHHAEINFLQQ